MLEVANSGRELARPSAAWVNTLFSCSPARCGAGAVLDIYGTFAIMYLTKQLEEMAAPHLLRAR